MFAISGAVQGIWAGVNVTVVEVAASAFELAEQGGDEAARAAGARGDRGPGAVAWSAVRRCDGTCGVPPWVLLSDGFRGNRPEGRLAAYRLKMAITG